MRIDYADRDFDRDERAVINLIRVVLCLIVITVFHYLTK